MSDVGINIPVWLALVVLGAEVWPLIVVLAVVAVAVAFATSGLWRGAAIVMACVFAIDLGASTLFKLATVRDDANARADEQSLDSVLHDPATVDGLDLPAGTAITWADPAHTHLAAAILPQPAPLLGLMADRVQPIVDGGWAVHLASPQSVDGWTCQPDFVELTPSGHLRRCVLASEREWNGWTIPAATLVTPGDLTVGFVFPSAIMAREIGRPLPDTGGMTMNTDGSLDRVYFESDAPLAVCGGTLWNTVTWRYDPGTFGQGRDRKPIAVSGADPANDDVEWTLPGCTK